MNITVVVCTYNPNPDCLRATLNALKSQTLDRKDWECIIVDNASSPPLDRDWCRELAGPVRVVRESEPGLSHARLRGVREALADIVVFCDDDNVMAPDYLNFAQKRMLQAPTVGVAGGKSLPRYLTPVPDWFVEGMAPLGCRDMGKTEIVYPASSYITERQYPGCAPIGAGMVFRKKAVDSWAASVGKSGISDRTGKSLSSAGDCDIVLHALGSGFDVAYWPQLLLHHLMPPSRVTPSYLGEISRVAFRDFIRVLNIHGIRPWSPIHPYTIPLRCVKAWLSHKAWRGPVESVRWQSSIGQFEGRATLSIN